MKLQTLDLFEAPIRSALSDPSRSGVTIRKTAAIARITYRGKREGMSHVKAGDKIFWTQPVRILKSGEIGGREGDRYAAFGFNGPERANVIGFIPVSVASRKPPITVQSRVGMGAEAQRDVFRFIKRAIHDQLAGASVSLISMSPPGSQEPDIVIEVDGQRLQFEVKHRTGNSSLTTVFNKFVRRGEKSNSIDHIVSIMTGRPLTLEKLVNLRRKTDKSQGFPSDPGVGNVSGSFTPIGIKKDNPQMKELTKYLLPFFTSSGDNYFVLHYGQNDVKIFFTGHGNNILNMPVLDAFDVVKLDTYGAGYNGAIRMAVKVRFPSVVSEGIHLSDFIE